MKEKVATKENVASAEELAKKDPSLQAIRRKAELTQATRTPNGQNKKQNMRKDDSGYFACAKEK